MVFPRAKPQLGIGNQTPTAIIRFKRPKQVAMRGQIRATFLFLLDLFFSNIFAKSQLTYIIQKKIEEKTNRNPQKRAEEEKENFEK